MAKQGFRVSILIVTLWADTVWGHFVIAASTRIAVVGALHLLLMPTWARNSFHAC